MPVCPGSMGKPTPGYEIDIIDEDGAILPDGELGSIAVRTEPRPVGLFINYVDEAEVTAERFRNGWYRSEEHTSELQSLMRISYDVFCLKKKQNNEHVPNTAVTTYDNIALLA